MDTRMLAYEHAATMAEVANWANGLPGKEAPGSPGYRVVRVLRFQVLAKGDRYAALMLVEVTDSPVALKEADVIEIDNITSTIEDIPTSDSALSE
jgi:hypothetical protein